MAPNDRDAADDLPNELTDTESRYDERDQPQPLRDGDDLRTPQHQQPRNSNSNDTTGRRQVGAMPISFALLAQQQPWYFPSLLSRAAGFMDSPTPIERVVSQRERGDEDSNRGDRATLCDRELEEELPWNDDVDGAKREREEGRDEYDGDTSDDSNSHHLHKRRRVMEESSLAFYGSIYNSSEVQRIIFENTAAGSFSLLFKLMPSLGFNAFAARWALILFLGHTLQTALTNFEHHSGSYRLVPLLPALLPADAHVWMDNYLWNQPLVNVMLLYPHWLAEGAAPIWLACIFIPFMLADNLISLKDDYEYYKPRITIPAYQRTVEAGFLDIAASMTLSFVLIVVSLVWSLRWMLWVGLGFLNIPPAYFLWAHRQRIQYGIRMSTTNEKMSVHNQHHASTINGHNCYDKKVL